MNSKEFKILHTIGVFSSLNKPYAIYGAGAFTKGILQLVRDNKLKLPDVILDDTPKAEQFEGINVIETRKFKPDSGTGLILGTDFHQKSMKANLERFFGYDCGPIDLFSVQDNIAMIIDQEIKRVENKISYLIPQLIEAYHAKPEDMSSAHNLYEDPVNKAKEFERIADWVEKNDIPLRRCTIDIADFENWLEQFSDLRDYYITHGDVYIEKCLEHYLSYKYLGLKEGDTLIDVASANSPLSEALIKRNIKSYSLDMAFPEGMHGHQIGADAGNTGLPDGFADKLASHCAYECFMGDADVRYLSEASRILKPGGCYAILPLYLDNIYYNKTSAWCNQAEIPIDPKAKKLWRDDEYKAVFSRHYCPDSFKERIYSQLPEDTTGEILFFENIPELNEHYEGQRVYCYFMFFARKKG